MVCFSKLLICLIFDVDKKNSYELGKETTDPLEKKYKSDQKVTFSKLLLFFYYKLKIMCSFF